MPPRKTRSSASSSSSSTGNTTKKQTKLIPPPQPPSSMFLPPPQPRLIHHQNNSSLGPTPSPVPTRGDPLLALAGIADNELSDLMYEEVTEMILQKTKGKSNVEQAAFMKQLLEGTDFKKDFERRMERKFPVLDNILNGKIKLEKKQDLVEMEIIDD